MAKRIYLTKKQMDEKEKYINKYWSLSAGIMSGSFLFFILTHFFGMMPESYYISESMVPIAILAAMLLICYGTMKGFIKYNVLGEKA